MSRDITRTPPFTVGASITNQGVSLPFRLRDKFYVDVHIILSAVVKTTGITLKLLDSFDGGGQSSSWFDVGSESQVSVVTFTVASASDINTSTDAITKTAHGLNTGDPVLLKAGAAVPTGLTDGATYYVVKVDANTFKLAATQANAYLTTPVVVDITAVGTGSQTFAQAHYQIRMLKEDSSDQAQLPIEDMAIVAVSTGSGDSVTVANVFVADLA